MAGNSNLRIDGAINLPTMIAVVAGFVGLATSVAVAQASANEALEKVSKYEALPERMARVETNIDAIKTSQESIEMKLDKLLVRQPGD